MWNFILVTRFHSINRDFKLNWDSLSRDFTVHKVLSDQCINQSVNMLSVCLLSGVRCMSGEWGRVAMLKLCLKMEHFSPQKKSPAIEAGKCQRFINNPSFSSISRRTDKRTDRQTDRQTSWSSYSTYVWYIRFSSFSAFNLLPKKTLLIRPTRRRSSRYEKQMTATTSSSMDFVKGPKNVPSLNKYFYTRQKL